VKMEKIASDESHWIDETAKICGDVTVGCAETAGVLARAIKSADSLKEGHANLAAITGKLEADIADVALATSEAQALSQSAREKLESGNRTIQMSMESFSEMIVLINHLGSHITGFASAMEQVKHVSQTIDTIARTTNMLALNAAIEAEKAGEAGLTFAVVAGEVKKLALDTRSAAVEITGTVNSLSDEASKFVDQIEAGIAGSDAAQRQYANLQSLLSGVSEIVTNVGEYNQEIANSTSAIHRSLNESQNVRSSVADANDEMHQWLENAHEQINALEFKSNRMFDHIVHSGLAKDDMPLVALAQEHAVNIQALTEKALESTNLGLNDLFDTHLRPIQGSNPPRFMTGLSKWADDNWQPIFDHIKANNPTVISVVCSSREGFLPTHMKAFSRAPTGDIAHDTRYCRNGRVLMDGIDYAAKASEQDYMMAVYRHEGDGKIHQTVRNVYLPLYFNGRRWGDLEIAYIL
jgi:methyl-accepting chemotaxis protein